MIQSLHKESFYTQQVFSQRCFYTQKLLHTEAFTHREAFTHSKFLHTKSFTHSKLLQKQVFTQRSFLVHNHNRNCSSKAGRMDLGANAKKKMKHFLKGRLKGKLLAPKLKISADKSISQAFGTSFAACRTKDSLCQASHTREV